MSSGGTSNSGEVELIICIDMSYAHLPVGTRITLWLSGILVESLIHVMVNDGEDGSGRGSISNL